MGTESPFPKYHRVYLMLREQLHEGLFAQGLPGEMTLMREFQVARVTVRRALDMLSNDRLISRRRGRVSQPCQTAMAQDNHAVASPRLNGLLENILSLGMHTLVRVLEVETIPASHAVADALRLRPGTLVQRAIRVRSTRQGPLSHITTYVPATLTRNIGRRELASTPLLVLLERSGVKVGRTLQTISARLADATVAKHLEVPVGAALLAVDRQIFDRAGHPAQLLEGLYRPDRYAYQMELTRAGAINAKVSVAT